MTKPSNITRMLCTWLLAATVAAPALAEVPTPKSFLNMSVSDLSIVCDYMLERAAAHGTRLVYITEEEERVAKMFLQESYAWRSARIGYDSKRAMALYDWQRKQPAVESFEQFKWCMETGDAIHTSLSQSTKAKIAKDANEAFLKLGRVPNFV